MSDNSVAYVGRQLAHALRRFANTREDGWRKEIARLQTELCQQVRNEENERDQIQSDVAQPWLPSE